MSKISEYNSTPCKLTGKFCDKTCELWTECPLEEHDLSDFKFIDEVIKYTKKRYKGNKGKNKEIPNEKKV